MDFYLWEMYGQNVDISSTETRKELEVELEAQGLFLHIGWKSF